MQIIHKASDDVMTLWNEGKILPTKTYRLLTYTLSEAVEGGMLMHNVVTGELILLSTEEMRPLSALPCAYAPWMDGLIKKHFLVKNDIQDERSVESLRTAMRAFEKHKKLSAYTILPTSYCNARCFYCYESNTVHTNMSEETARKTVDFIDATHSNAPISIHWFGGEPMLGIKRIDMICALLNERKIEFSSLMTSNGYLFTKELAAHARSDWKLDNIQITLDGTEEVYRRTKAYVNSCENPLAQVLDNIGYLLNEEITVYIRLNLGMHNSEDLTKLVNLLGKRFEKKEKLYVYTHLLYDNCGIKPVHFEEHERLKLECQKKVLSKLIKETGFMQSEPSLPTLKIYKCMADEDSSVVIFPDGSLGKCEEMLDGIYVGNVEDGITEKSAVLSMKEREQYPFCIKCRLYPFCIRLKKCKPRTRCSQEKAEQLIEGHKLTMKHHYEAYLREDKKESAETEMLDCQKGEIYEKI